MPTNTNLLKGKMAEKGFSQILLAEKLGISYQAFNNKLHNKSEFKASEIQMLCDLLCLENKDAYFFVS
ncbi:MAG: DUF739 family protein [Clostridia bacterium]|nr:DUF739 family protein [Clostridia bacterium]